MSNVHPTAQLKQDAIFYFAGRMIPAGLSLLSVAIFIQCLGEEKYGGYTLIISSTLLISNVSASWLTQSILRYQSTVDSQGYSQFIQALWLGTLKTAIAATIVTSIFMTIWLSDTIETIGLAVLIVLSSLVYSIASAQQQANLESRRVLVAELVRTILTFGGSIVVLIFLKEKSDIALLMMIIIGNTCGLLVSLPRKVLKQSQLSSLDAKPLLQKFWNYGAPMALWIGVATFLNICDRYVISTLVSVEAVGTYSAIYDVVYKSCGLLLTPIVSAAHPLIMKAWNHGEHHATHRLMKQTFVFQASVSFFMVIGLTAISPCLVQLVIHRVDPISVQMIFPIALGAAIWQLAMIAHKHLEVHQKTGYLLGFITFALMANIGLNYMLIPRFGYIAAAYTTLISSCIYIILTGMYIILRDVDTIGRV